MPSVVPSEIVRLVDRFFAFAAKGTAPTERVGISQIGRLNAVIALIDRLPPELLVMAPDAYAEFVAALEMLRGKTAIAGTRGTGYDFNAEPVWRLRHRLAACPDAAPTRVANDLRFLRSRAPRDELRRDLTEAYQSLNDGRYKASTVLAGAVLEALLVWKLSLVPAPARAAALESLFSDPRRRPSNSPESWSFAQLIDVIAHLKLVTDDTIKQVRLAKDYRNLIHPGRAIRKGQRCGKDTALGALAGAERLIAEFSK
jgi:hypothetical protein